MISSLSRAQFSFCATVLFLTGCSNSSPEQQLAPGLTQQNPAPSGLSAQWLGHPLLETVKNGFAKAKTIQPDRRRSWMAPDAKKDDLLYISDGSTYDVYVYSYPSGKLVGTLTGFTEPTGECVDKTGDVFITTSTFYGTGTIFEYAHGGTQPIATLSDPDGNPRGCSVDPTTGNLAVTNFASASGGGSVSVYTDAEGTPSAYTDSAIYTYFFCGYDREGNLFIDGRSYGGATQFAELPDGQETFTNISLNQSIGYPGGVQWHGKYVAVGDQDVNVIYQFTISGGMGSKARSTLLTGAGDVVQFWIDGAKVVGPDSQNSDVGFWKYPAGGTATKIITEDLSDPYGAVVSKAKKL
jgi:hypothetical protein